MNDDEDFEVKTICGALMSLFSAFVIIVLILSEMYAYIWPPTAEHIVVDHQLGEKLQINFDITFPALRCSGKCCAFVVFSSVPLIFPCWLEQKRTST